MNFNVVCSSCRLQRSSDIYGVTICDPLKMVLSLLESTSSTSLHSPTSGDHSEIKKRCSFRPLQVQAQLITVSYSINVEWEISLIRILGIIGNLSGRVILHEVLNICGSLFAMLATVIVHV